MNAGRWYPSALTLPDGSVLAISGSLSTGFVVNNVPQLWRNEKWNTLPTRKLVTPLYPKLHLDPSGRVFVAGPQKQSQFLTVHPTDASLSTWKLDGPVRGAGQREYGSSVMYDSGKILFCGGGNDRDPQGKEMWGPTTNMTEIIDLNPRVQDGTTVTPTWELSEEMLFPRRHHNPTVLPDGTVLVTGGTKGVGFNNLLDNNPVHEAELWDPSGSNGHGSWTLMAKEDSDRCYHGTALLLPDGQVLSAGSGEYAPDPPPGLPNPLRNPNDPKDSLTNAQLFSPPYLCKGIARPAIVNFQPTKIDYKSTISLNVGPKDVIKKASWVRLGSNTHANNMNQSLMFLKCEQAGQGAKVTITAPDNANLAPPGQYMLFLLNADGVPAVAPIIQIADLTKKPAAISARMAAPAAMVAFPEPIMSLPDLNEKVIAEQEGPAVAVGLTPVCPYGLGPCWGGAFEALQNISDTEVVRPVPDQTDSVAFVYLKQDILPDIDVWRSEFGKIAHGGYFMRGTEMTLSGTVTEKRVGTDEQLTLTGTSTRPDLLLAPFQQSSNINWDLRHQVAKPITDKEAGAYARLSKALTGEAVTVQVTGRLQKNDAGKFSLDVKETSFQREIRYCASVVE